MDVLYYTRYDIGLVDAEALIFPEVAVDYAFSDRLLHYRGGVQAVGREGPRGAALVKEALFVCAVVCHGFFVWRVLQYCDRLGVLGFQLEW